MGSELALAPARLDPAGRRSRLRDYQTQLIERMQAARSGGAARAHQLGVTVGTGRYLLDLSEAGEIVAPPPLAKVPLTLPWYLGLANVRGNLLGVIDLARYLGAGDAVSGPDARLVTFAPRLGFNCALLVSRVHGLRRAADMTATGARLRDADANEWTPLSLATLVQDERFVHIGR
jgi:twitching motility protein PilI